MDRLYRRPFALSPPFFFCKSPVPHPHYFYPLIQQEEQPPRGKHGLGRGGGNGAITWKQRVIMAADALLHFHSCGVAHLWAAITDQMIQTGPCDEVAGLTEWLAAPLSFACVHGVVLCAFNRMELSDVPCTCICAFFAWMRNKPELCKIAKLCFIFKLYFKFIT